VVTPARLVGSIWPDDPLGGDVAGLRIGAFTIRRLLGAGGMGAVYEAEQDNPRRLVAIKVLRPELCSGNGLRRFQVETDILARLHHPGIAEIYAAGVHRAEAGPFRWEMPFYAMELLDGARPLDAWAAAEAPDLPARLELLRKVCSAVHHAHQR